MNKTIKIEIRKWSRHTNVAIFDLVRGGLPRVRNSSSQSHLNKILKDEKAFAPHVELVTINNGQPSSNWSNTIDFKPMKINWRTELSNSSVG